MKPKDSPTALDEQVGRIADSLRLATKREMKNKPWSLAYLDVRRWVFDHWATDQSDNRGASRVPGLDGWDCWVFEPLGLEQSRLGTWVIQINPNELTQSPSPAEIAPLVAEALKLSDQANPEHQYGLLLTVYPNNKHELKLDYGGFDPPAALTKMVNRMGEILFTATVNEMQGRPWTLSFSDARGSSTVGQSRIGKWRIQLPDGSIHVHPRMRRPHEMAPIEQEAFDLRDEAFSDKWYGLVITVFPDRRCEANFNNDPNCSQDASFYDV